MLGWRILHPQDLKLGALSFAICDWCGCSLSLSIDLAHENHIVESITIQRFLLRMQWIFAHIGTIHILLHSDNLLQSVNLSFPLFFFFQILRFSRFGLFHQVVDQSLQLQKCFPFVFYRIFEEIDNSTEWTLLWDIFYWRFISVFLVIWFQGFFSVLNILNIFLLTCEQCPHFNFIFCLLFMESLNWWWILFLALFGSFQFFNGFFENLVRCFHLTLQSRWELFIIFKVLVQIFEIGLQIGILSS